MPWCYVEDVWCYAKDVFCWWCYTIGRCFSLMCLSLMMLYRCLRRRRHLHTHTHTKTVDKTSKGLGVPGRSCVARNSHNQHPERIFVVENLKCANYRSFKGLKSYCDWPYHHRHGLLHGLTTLFLAFVVRFWNFDNEASASFGTDPLCMRLGGGSKPHM